MIYSSVRAIPVVSPRERLSIHEDLLSKRRLKDNPRITVLEFEANGIPLMEWQDKQAKIEAAFDLNIAAIKEGWGKRRILLYTTPAISELPEVIYWKDGYLDKDRFVLVLGESVFGRVTVNLAQIPHILLGGSTGSGKSVLLKLLLMQCVQLLRAGCVHFLSHDLFNFTQHTQAGREPGVYAGGDLPNQGSAQHQAVRVRFRISRQFTQCIGKQFGASHFISPFGKFFLGIKKRPSHLGRIIDPRYHPFWPCGPLNRRISAPNRRKLTASPGWEGGLLWKSFHLASSL